MPRPESYLFIDESGVEGFDPREQHGQYLGLLGCAIRAADYWRIVKPAIEALKLRQFPGCDPTRTVLHRSHIVGRKGVFGALKNADRQAAFDADMLKLYAELPYSLIGIVVDKVAHARHSERFFANPYHWALAMMLERFAGLMKVSRRIGRVICEARGPYPDRLLQGAYSEIASRGTRYHTASFFHEFLPAKKIVFRPKIPAVAGLEIADGLVRTAKLEILAENGKSEPVHHPFQAAIEGVIGAKWNRRVGTGEVAGYGKALFTLPY